MKIWIDLTNSPHIGFFKPFIERWQSEGHLVIITARNLANTIDLLGQTGWAYKEVGGHAGRNKLLKLMYFPRRVFLLYRYLQTFKPDVGISQSSFYSPVVGRLLGFPTIYMNDNEHAKGNLIAFRFSTLVLLPEFLRDKAYDQGWMNKYRIDFYPGIKEGIYLSQSDYKRSDSSGRSVFVRPEPHTAQYYNGNGHSLDDLIMKLKNDYHFTILPRDARQANHYSTSTFQGVTVARKAMPLAEICEKCTLFIGAGGSMTRELAFLGIPALSVYQDNLLEVDKFLIQHKLMFFDKNPDADRILSLLHMPQTSRNKQLQQKGLEAFRMINHLVKEYAGN